VNIYYKTPLTFSYSHRARNLASKNIASKSAAAIAEILGMAPSTSTSAAASASTSGTLTPITDPELEKLTTSTVSVGDYFKERLLAKSRAASGTATPSSVSKTPDDDSDIAPRGGLGSSRLRNEVLQDDEDAAAERIGLSRFSSLMSSTFLAAAAAAAVETVSVETKGHDNVSDELAGEVGAPVKEKKKKKKEKIQAEVIQRSEESENAGSIEAVMLSVDDSTTVMSKEERKRLKAESKRRKETNEATPTTLPTAVDDSAERLSKEERRRLKAERKAEKEQRRLLKVS
jgi:Pin2-interacting protein X1